MKTYMSYVTLSYLTTNTIMSKYALKCVDVTKAPFKRRKYAYVCKFAHE